MVDENPPPPAAIPRTTGEPPVHSSQAVVAIDAATHQVLGSAPTGAGPAHVVLTPDGARAYVTNSSDTYDDTVSVLDLAHNTVVATVPVGDKPNGITYSARTPTPGHPTMELDVPNYAMGAAGQHGYSSGGHEH
jgi:YVTN family beta-propeller protein